MLKKKLNMLSTALSAVVATGAWAQSSSTDPSKPEPAIQAQPVIKDSSGKMHFVSSQKPDQWLASKFKGTDVLGSDNQKIGDVSDILFDKTGKVEAFVISVGGFLGVGSKEVASRQVLSTSCQARTARLPSSRSRRQRISSRTRRISRTMSLRVRPARPVRARRRAVA